MYLLLASLLKTFPLLLNWHTNSTLLFFCHVEFSHVYHTYSITKPVLYQDCSGKDKSISECGLWETWCVTALYLMGGRFPKHFMSNWRAKIGKNCPVVFKTYQGLNMLSFLLVVLPPLSCRYFFFLFILICFKKCQPWPLMVLVHM